MKQEALAATLEEGVEETWTAAHLGRVGRGQKAPVVEEPRQLVGPDGERREAYPERVTPAERGRPQRQGTTHQHVERVGRRLRAADPDEDEERAGDGAGGGPLLLHFEAPDHQHEQEGEARGLQTRHGPQGQGRVGGDDRRCDQAGAVPELQAACQGEGRRDAEERGQQPPELQSEDRRGADGHERRAVERPEWVREALHGFPWVPDKLPMRHEVLAVPERDEGVIDRVGPKGQRARQQEGRERREDAEGALAGWVGGREPVHGAEDRQMARCDRARSVLSLARRPAGRHEWMGAHWFRPVYVATRLRAGDPRSPR